MQTLLPFFPEGTNLITPVLGFTKKDNFIYYYLAGLPIYSHAENHTKKFRYISSNFIIEGLCTRRNIANAFGVSYESVKKSVKKLKEEGEEGFFIKRSNTGEGNTKIKGDLQTIIQSKLDNNQSAYSIAKEENLTEGAIRAAIKRGVLKKKDKTIISDINASNKYDRTQLDFQASLGIGATNIEARQLASKGCLEQVDTEFIPSNSVCNAGVLFFLPSLLSQGLLKSKDIYGSLEKGYYGLTHIVMLLTFMALSRIKNPEQLQRQKPGEWGKILGIDRAPEVKCLRNKLSEISKQNKSEKFLNDLSSYWISLDENQGGYFFIDGHVRIYNGYLANRPKTHVSRQKLCLPATTDWWVNDWMGKPYFFIPGEVNEKLLKIVDEEIIVKLKDDLEASASDKDLSENDKLPRFTLVFDREGYSPKQWKKWWEEHRIAIISYRKNVTEKWDEKDFYDAEIIVAGKKQTIKIAEKQVEVDGFHLREIRKLSSSGKQASMYSSNYIDSTSKLAGEMFSRWSQENYFKYMESDYDIDHLIEYAHSQIDENTKIVNPLYREKTKILEKTRLKLRKTRADYMKLCDDVLSDDNEENKKIMQKKADLSEDIEHLKTKEEEQFKDRKKHKYHIPMSEIPEEDRYTKLTEEKRSFVELLKMMAFRAETVMVNLLSEHYTRSMDEGRMLAKEIINNEANIIPDYTNNTLTIKLHSLSTPRANNAVKSICKSLNETETIYPETKLKMIFETF